MMMEGSGTLSEILLWGNTWPPFTKTSSFTITSSPRTVIPSRRTQRPTMHRQPMMQELNQEWDFTIAPVGKCCIESSKLSPMRSHSPLRIVHLLMQTPEKENFVRAEIRLALLIIRTILDNDTRANSYVWSNATATTDFCSWIDDNVTDHARTVVELWRIPLSQRRQVQAHPCQEVFWLPNVHPESIKFKGIELLVPRHKRENFFLNRCWFEFDTRQDRSIENVHARVDLVADKLLRLFNETFDSPLRVIDDNSVLRRLFYFCDNNCSFLAVIAMEFLKFFEWKITNNVGVQHEKRLVAVRKNVFGQSKWTGSSKRLHFVWEDESHAQLFSFFFEFSFHLLSPIWNSENHLKKSLTLLQNCLTLQNLFALTSRTPASFKASIWCNKIGLFANSTRGFGRLNVRGLNRVPKIFTKCCHRVFD